MKGIFNMKRNVIEINREKCIGCGACAESCHQGAIAMVDGKAKLVREDHCDGLGMCLPACPVDAIKIIEKEVEVKPQFVCPSTVAKKVKRKEVSKKIEPSGKIESELKQWPVQIKLANPIAPYFNGADLLIAADCCSFAYGDFHRDFMKDKITLIGCPKLDAVDYSEKLADIIANNDINSITVTRMTVPCCGGMTRAIEMALAKSGKDVPLNVYVISPEGNITEHKSSNNNHQAV